MAHPGACGHDLVLAYARQEARGERLGVGYTHRGTKVLAIADDTTITVINLLTSEILSTHTIDPTRNYWRNTQKAPGRWPGAPQQ